MQARDRHDQSGPCQAHCIHAGQKHILLNASHLWNIIASASVIKERDTVLMDGKEASHHNFDVG